MKTCSKCNEQKPYESFRPYARGSGGLSPECKNCRRLWEREYRTKNKERLNEWFRGYYEKNKDAMRKYSREWHKRNQNCWKASLRRRGMTKEAYDALYDKQNGCCKICGQKRERGGTNATPGKILCMDHCHASGNFRGLLCNKCNTAIGLLGDSPETLQRAISYLENFFSKKAS